MIHKIAYLAFVVTFLLGMMCDKNYKDSKVYYFQSGIIILVAMFMIAGIK